MSFHNSYFQGSIDALKFKSFLSFLDKKFNVEGKRDKFESSVNELMAAVNPDMPFARAKIQDDSVTIYPKNDKGQETGKIVFS